MALPPKRVVDHWIKLEDVKPVNVRPYRYRHTQKDEIKKLVNEMLAAKITKPSSLLEPYFIGQEERRGMAFLLLEVKSINHSRQVPNSCNKRIDWWIARVGNFFEVGFEDWLSSNTNVWAMYREDNLLYAWGALWILSNAVWINQCSGDLPINNESGIPPFFEETCFGFLWWCFSI